MPLPQPHPVAILLIMALLASIAAVWAAVVLRFFLRKPILPPNTPRIVPWGAGTVLASILLWFAMQASAGIVYRIVTRPPGGEGPAAAASPLGPAEMMGLSAVGNVAAVILISALLAATSGARPCDLGLGGPGASRKILQGILAWPLLAPCVFGLMLVAVGIWGKSNHPLQEAMTKDRSPETVALLAFAGVIMAPISEELVFRGVLLGWLTKLAMGVRALAKPDAGIEWADDPAPTSEPAEGSFLAPIAVDAVDADEDNPYRAPRAAIADAIPASAPEPRPDRLGRVLLANMAVSAVFALLHGPQWPAPVPLFVLSMGLGVLYQRTGSLLGPIALHMTFNGISTLMLFLAGTATPPADPQANDPVPGPAIIRFEPREVEFGRGSRLTRDDSRL